MLMINAQHAQISAFRNRASGSSCVRNELQLQAHLALDKTESGHKREHGLKSQAGGTP
jgi:hypothetical protein